MGSTSTPIPTPSVKSPDTAQSKDSTSSTQKPSTLTKKGKVAETEGQPGKPQEGANIVPDSSTCKKGAKKPPKGKRNTTGKKKEAPSTKGKGGKRKISEKYGR